MTKTRQDNNVTNRIDLVYAKNDSKLSGLIRPGAIYDEIGQDNDVTDLPRTVYVKNKTKISLLTKLGAVYHKNQTKQLHN